MELAKHWAEGLEDYVIALAWSPDGSLLAAASAAGPVALFATGDGARLHELPGHENGTNCLAWSPAGLLATGGQDGSVRFWEAASGRQSAEAAMGQAWVEHLCWCGAESKPAFAAASGRKLVFLAPDGAILHAAPDAAKTISALTRRPGAPLIAAAHFGAVRLIGADDGAARKELAYPNGIQTLAWSPDGKWLVSGNQDPSVHLWIPDRDEELHMSGYETKVKHLSFDPTSRWLATSGGRDACIWDCSGPGPEGRAPGMLPHDAPVCAVAFQRAHGLLATASTDATIHLWSPERRQPLRATVRVPAAAVELAWSADDSLLAIGTEKGQIYALKCSP
jgi:WD40 repeat protein